MTSTAAVEFDDFVEPEHPESDVFKPKENYDKPLIVKVLEHKDGIITEFSPEGGAGVIVDLVDLTDGKVYRNVLWMGGSIVDGLKPRVGNARPLVMRFDKRKSAAGRSYPAPKPGSAEDKTLAQRFYASKGDPFVQQFADPFESDSAPF